MVDRTSRPRSRLDAALWQTWLTPTHEGEVTVEDREGLEPRVTSDHVLQPPFAGVLEVYGTVSYTSTKPMAKGKPREDAILSSTIELLGEVGYDAMTMDAVAGRARASKATMYRRWRNKAALVAAALDHLDAGHNAAIPDTGALRSDLVAVMKSARDRATPAYVAMIHGLVIAARRDKALAASLRSHVEDDELSPFHAVLRRAVEKKWLPADAPVSVVGDVAEAMILRQLQTGAPFDRAFIHRVVDDVLVPLLRSKNEKRRRR